MKKQIEIYKIICQGDWEKFYTIINQINSDETFWDDIDKYQLAELNFICWELYVEHGVGIYKELNEEFIWNEIGKTLADGYNCYLKRFKKDNDLTSLMGYMISVVDFPFEASEGMGLKFEEMGKQMMKDAYKNEPENPFIACLNARGRAKNKYSKDAREYLHRVFKGCDGLIDYFYGRLENY